MAGFGVYSLKSGQNQDWEKSQLTDPPITFCHAETPEGPRDFVTCLSQEHVLKRGVPAEAVIGVLTRPLKLNEAITPSVFGVNRYFLETMHAIIARRAPGLAGLIAEAKRQGEGWVVIVDQRTPDPQGAVPPEDIVGHFEVKNGAVTPGSYQPNPRHKILSERGFFHLGGELHPCLLEELAGYSD